MKQLTIFLFIFLSSCSSNQEKKHLLKEKRKKEKSLHPAEFASQYCECLTKENTESDCEGILQKFQEQYGSQNKKAENEFSIEMQNCL